MPRFHLHIRTPAGFVEDQEGGDYADYDAAVAAAVRGARCLMTGEVAGGTLCLDQSIEIYDSAGLHLTSLPFTEALTLINAPEKVGQIGDGRTS